MEQTFFIIKPDGVKRGLVGEVLKRVEQRGYKIERLEMRTNVSNELIDQHYEALLTKDFYPSIRDYMTSGPVIIGVLSGSQVISGWRHMMGATRPEEALPGTILHKQLKLVKRFEMLFMVQILKSLPNGKLRFGLVIIKT